MDKDLRKVIDEVCKEQHEEVLQHFELLKKHNCLDRIDEREQFIMKIMPLSFRMKLLRKLGVLDDSFERNISCNKTTN